MPSTIVSFASIPSVRSKNVTYAEVSKLASGKEMEERRKGK